VRGAAQQRKRLRGELRRIGATQVSLYIDGPRGVVRLQFPSRAGDFRVPVNEGLALLRALPSGAGTQATVDALRSHGIDAEGSQPPARTARAATPM
jgi:hypothetical protein